MVMTSHIDFLRRKHRRGQTAIESMIMLPLLFTLVFLLLQIGHLGIAIAIVHFSASSAAKLAVDQNSASNLESQAERVLSAGLELLSAKGDIADNGPTSTITVTVCSQLDVYPFVGPVLDAAFSATGGGGGCFSGGAKTFGPIGLTSAPYKFIIQGVAKARMNYNSK